MLDGTITYIFSDPDSDNGHNQDLRADDDIRTDINSYKVSQIVVKTKAAKNLKV